MHFCIIFLSFGLWFRYAVIPPCGRPDRRVAVFLGSDCYFYITPYSNRVKTHAGACMLVSLMLMLLSNVVQSKN